MYTAKGKVDQGSLLDQYLPLVRRQALALQVRLPASVDLDDLIQAGAVGLLDAFNRYDASAGATFATFASQRIRGAMLDELRTRDWLPRSVRRQARAMEESHRRLAQQLGRAPDERDIAGDLGMPLAEYLKLLNDTNCGLLMPFEEVVAAGGEPAPEQAESQTPQALLEAFEDQTQLAAAIEALPEREKLLMALYYQEELNLKEIGLVLGVSESRVCQLHSQAIRRLRAQLL